jgi:hypothetical protein
MEDFKVGETLICKNSKPLQGNDIAPPLEEEVEYTVREVITCVCGSKHFNVGLKSEYNFITCYECKEELPRGKDIHWCHPSRFVTKT